MLTVKLFSLVKLDIKVIFFVNFGCAISFTVDFLFILIFYPVAVNATFCKFSNIIINKFLATGIVHVTIGYSYFFVIPAFVTSLISMAFSGYYYYKIYFSQS